MDNLPQFIVDEKMTDGDSNVQPIKKAFGAPITGKCSYCYHTTKCLSKYECWNSTPWTGSLTIEKRTTNVCLDCLSRFLNKLN